MQGYKRVRIFTERDLRSTKLEIAVLDTRTMQRLRNIRQLGQSLVAYPTAEHSRFSHSLGTLYWAAKMLSYLRENYFSQGANGNIALYDTPQNLDRATRCMLAYQSRKEGKANGQHAEES